MKTRLRITSLLLTSFAIFFGSGARAQQLQDGVWEGMRTSPTEASPTVKVDMRVTNRSDGTIAIYLLHVLGMAQATDVALEDGELRYSFKVPGREIISECVLQAKSHGSYSGPCSGDNGAEFLYTYEPPAAQDNAAAGGR